MTDADWIHLLVGALIMSCAYSSVITWAVRNRPTFAQSEDQIVKALDASPYSKEQRLIFEKLEQMDSHLKRLEGKIDDTITLVQYPRPKA